MHERLAAMLHHGLGDVICAVPGLWQADQALGTRGSMELVVKNHFEASLIHAVPWRSTVTCHLLGPTDSGRWLRALTTCALTLRGKRPDVFVTPHVTSPAIAEVLGLVVGARKTVTTSRSVLPQHGRVSESPGEHKVQYYARFLHEAGLIQKDALLAFPHLRGEQSHGTEKPRIVVSPTVGAPLEQHKRWPPSQFALLVPALLDRFPDASVELFGAPSERPQLESILHDAGGKASIITPTDPAAAVAHLRSASCLIAACGGATHLAALADIPIVGIYGPTNPGFTGPYTKKLYTVHQQLACAPCYRPGFTSGCGTPVCMTQIGLAPVLALVEAALSGQEPPQYPWRPTTSATLPAIRDEDQH